MTTAEKGSNVRVHYRGTLTTGEEFDNSYERGTPIEFQIGAGQMIRGFDTAVEGMTVGSKKTVTLTPDEAYGDTNPEASTQMPVSAFPDDLELTEGMPVPLATQEGHRLMGRIETVSEDTVTIDLNHPLAGQELNFEIELVEVV
jgi:peptidylprolyl isomerase